MNDLDAWSSAPCLKAYLDDLARYGKSLESTYSGSGGGRKSLPLIYAATQHDSPSAETTSRRGNQIDSRLSIMHQ